MSMEYTLSHIVREFDQEKEIISKLAKQEIDKVRYTVDTLKSELDIRIKQMKQIRVRFIIIIIYINTKSYKR